MSKSHFMFIKADCRDGVRPAHVQLYREGGGIIPHACTVEHFLWIKGCFKQHSKVLDFASNFTGDHLFEFFLFSDKVWL